MKTAPIILFTYNRLKHTQQTIEALQNNRLASKSDLIVFSDAGKNEDAQRQVELVRNFIASIEGFNKVKLVKRDINFGLAKNVIAGVSQVLSESEKVIVLEDDLVTSPYFLDFMNEGLALYANTEEVASIHGYVYPIDGLPDQFFLRGADCWGWATWKRAWRHFEADGKKLLDRYQKSGLEKIADFDGSYKFSDMLRDQIAGRNNSWAIRWYFSALLDGLYTLYPGKSFVKNIGNDGSGTHSASPVLRDPYDTTVTQQKLSLRPIPVEDSPVARQKFVEFFNALKASTPQEHLLMRKIWRKFRQFLP
jgi:hypothetical protein